MRKIKIAGILFFTGVCICLCAILVLALNGRGWNGGEGWDVQGKYHLVLEKEIPVEEIRGLKIDYSMTFNDVTFYQGEGESVVIREYMNFEPEEKQISRVEQEGGDILVKGVNRNRFVFFSLRGWDAYTEVYLPAGFAEGLEKLYVRTVSGDVRSEIPLGGGEVFSVASTSGDIYLPNVQAEELKVSSTSGDIRMETLAGQTAVSTTSGDISLGQVDGAAKVSSTSGEIRVDGIQGETAVTTTSGDISLGIIQGDMNLSTTSGEVRIQEGKGRFEAESTSGDIRLELLEGEFHVKSTSGEVALLNGTGWGRAGTISGDVRISLEALAGDLAVSTTSGEVGLGLPEEASLTLDFDSTSGACSTFFDDVLHFNKKGNQARGQYGDGENAVTVSTVSGDLRIVVR